MAFEREYELFGTKESYFKQLPTELQAKRLKLAESLRSVGLRPILPEGGYFMITDVSSLSESSIYTWSEKSSLHKMYMQGLSTEKLQ